MDIAKKEVGSSGTPLSESNDKKATKTEPYFFFACCAPSTILFNNLISKVVERYLKHQVPMKPTLTRADFFFFALVQLWRVSSLFFFLSH